MEFQDTYKAYVLTQGRVGTMEELGRRFIADYLNDRQGTELGRVARAYDRLDDAFRHCNTIGDSQTDLINLECLAWCTNLMITEGSKSK